MGAVAAMVWWLVTMDACQCVVLLLLSIRPGGEGEHEYLRSAMDGETRTWNGD